jgi:hypothetical protein
MLTFIIKIEKMLNSPRTMIDLIYFQQGDINPQKTYHHRSLFLLKSETMSNFKTTKTDERLRLPRNSWHRSKISRKKELKSSNEPQKLLANKIYEIKRKSWTLSEYQIGETPVVAQTSRLPNRRFYL